MVHNYEIIRTIGLHEQMTHMGIFHPNFDCCIERRKGRATLVCRGIVQPTPLSACYKARIEYGIPLTPKVWIESPALERRLPEERIPHTYAEDRPCLFKKDFRSDMRISHTIVPWLSLWLFFYESWRVTGEWQGGGLHPTPAECETIKKDTERDNDVTV